MEIARDTYWPSTFRLVETDHPRRTVCPSGRLVLRTPIPPPSVIAFLTISQMPRHLDKRPAQPGSPPFRVYRFWGPAGAANKRQECKTTIDRSCSTKPDDLVARKQPHPTQD